MGCPPWIRWNLNHNDPSLSLTPCLLSSHQVYLHGFSPVCTTKLCCFIQTHNLWLGMLSGNIILILQKICFHNFTQINNWYQTDLVRITNIKRVPTHIWCPPRLPSHRVVCLHLFSTPPPQQSEQQGSLLSDLHLPGEADHNPSSPGRLTRLPRGSGYRHGLTETNSKPCIWNLFLCSDTLHFICIFTYSEPGAGFLSVRDRGKTGHRQSWCVFIRFQKGLCHWISETNQGAAERLAQNSSDRAGISNEINIFGGIKIVWTVRTGTEN